MSLSKGVNLPILMKKVLDQEDNVKEIQPRSQENTLVDNMQLNMRNTLGSSKVIWEARNPVFRRVMKQAIWPNSNRNTKSAIINIENGAIFIRGGPFNPFLNMPL